MHKEHLKELAENGGQFDQFLTTCPRCGGGMKLYAYRLEYQGRGRRFTEADVPICGDGFTVCDDLWGTKYEDEDQSTSDEVVECYECGRLGDLMMRETEDEQVCVVSKTMLGELLARLEKSRPTNKRLVNRLTYDPREELIADLTAAIGRSFKPTEAFVGAIPDNEEVEETEA